MNSASQVQILDEAVCISFQSCFLKKGMNLSLLPPVMSMYLPNPTTTDSMRHGQFLSGVKMVRIQSFPSLRLVA